MDIAKFDYAYMFMYSVRPNTFAAKNYEDDVPDAVKNKRLEEIIKFQSKLSLESNKRDLNKLFNVLVEGVSKRSTEKLFGRNSQNKVIVFPSEVNRVGTYVDVLVTNCTQATLTGFIKGDLSKLQIK